MNRMLSGLALLALAAPAHAQESSGPYVGLSVGSFDYEETDPALSLTIADNPTSYQLFGGYRFSEYLALEGSWGMTDDIKESFTDTDPVLGDVSIDMNGEYKALTLRVLGMLPLGSTSLFGGLGYYDSDLDAAVNYEDDFQTFVGSSGETHSGMTAMGGVQYDFERISLRGAYEWFDADDDNIDASDLSVSVLFTF